MNEVAITLLDYLFIGALASAANTKSKSQYVACMWCLYLERFSCFKCMRFPEISAIWVGVFKSRASWYRAYCGIDSFDGTLARVIRKKDLRPCLFGFDSKCWFCNLFFIWFDFIIIIVIIITIINIWPIQHYIDIYITNCQAKKSQQMSNNRGRVSKLTKRGQDLHRGSFSFNCIFC